ncbi:sulfotransferase family protein [Streptomyces alanosinicus]|uniref:Sulfotransferase family protein n=1 Tax=Streptomyces alanosinicus TaxID=68171 RepID=A0A918YH58_9ACTN|nr:sulfotransferase family protein [Streptomyces alanosinicus]
MFGLGLSRTGTRSLTRALRTLGLDVRHYPADRGTWDTLMRGDARFPVLDHCDGIADITCVPYYEELDQAWAGSKYILTVRDEESWLRSCQFHWARPVESKRGKGQEYPELQRFLRAAVYACLEFDEDRFRRVYRRHVDSVRRYFADREEDLLVLDIAAGEGYERLAPFLGLPIPDEPFPHQGRRPAPVGDPQ